MRRHRPLALALALALGAAPVAAQAEPDPVEAELFDSWVGRYTDLDTAGLWKHLGVTDAADKPLSFSPAKARFHDLVAKKLGLSPAALAQLERDGVVLLDAGGMSVAGVMHRTFTSDLPLLVTTDAILDAVHRSFDTILAELEETTLRKLAKDALATAREPLKALAAKEPALAEAARDLDLYLTVALALLEGEPGTGRLLYSPSIVDDKDVLAILAKVDKLELENPGMGGGSTTLYGAERAVDWSQFKPRGHYTRSPQLTRYFRAMMWLGRADTGFEFAKIRQLRAASLLSLMLEQTGAGKKLQVLRDVVDLMVGRSDELTPAQLSATLFRLGLGTPAALAKSAPLERVRAELGALGLGQQRIRSQLVVSDPASADKVPPPPVFQLFGQRFVVDSFVLSKVVFDDIIYQGKKQERRMPSGLDVMAALGNDTAVRLLKGELDAWHYGANLATLRDVLGAWTDATWSDSLYNLWLDALRELSKAPAGKFVPEVMKRSPWAKKMLQTQLASWAQLRHDTILYAKQSYTASAGCSYPDGFVEPYPAFFGKLARFATAAATRLGALDGLPGNDVGRYVGYFEGFAKTMTTLADMAQRELDGKPFTKAQADFLERAIDKTAGKGGYMPVPTYNGWYVDLVFREMGKDSTDVVEWKPTIADVHTDPDAGRVLEEGVGGTRFAVVAIDNDGDTAVYVGPALSWYEFTWPAGDRLTDESWMGLLSDSKRPAQPAWAASLVAP
ncbi:MAG: DUF3160 domain-containing protein [Deltaproteobacteria bacterium]|nr:DUF3160 domain-containing protein [Deltaproteobacteria bacterium]